MSLYELDKNISLHLSTDRRKKRKKERERDREREKKDSKMALTHAHLFKDIRLRMDCMHM